MTAGFDAEQRGETRDDPSRHRDPAAVSVFTRPPKTRATRLRKAARLGAVEKSMP